MYLEGDFAVGVRTQPSNLGVDGDFGTGLRTMANTMIVGDFANGMQVASTLVGARGDFAAGQRGEAASGSRRVERSRAHDASLRWLGPEPAGMPGRS
jgi:hypothetical protein